MGEVNINLGDLRHVVPKIRAAAKGMVVQSVNDPGVKAAIMFELYDAIEGRIPEDTGALKYSPRTEGGVENMGPSKKWPKHKSDRYAHGNLTDMEMTFDPYTSYGTHYANKVDDFDPGGWLRASKKMKYEAIARIIVKGTKK